MKSKHYFLFHHHCFVNFNRTVISSDPSTSVQFHTILFKPWNHRRVLEEPSFSLSSCRCIVWSCRSVSLALHVPSYKPCNTWSRFDAWSDVTILTCVCLYLETKQKDVLLFKGFLCVCMCTEDFGLRSLVISALWFPSTLQTFEVYIVLEDWCACVRQVVNVSVKSE